ncbi:MAG: hypothetical protein R3B93_14275 [Bacteroidia bacterium]
MAEIIKGLDKKDRNKLKKFAQMPLLTISSMELKLLRYFIQNVDKSDDETVFSKEAIQNKIFPNQVITSKSWNYLANHILELVREFLLYNLVIKSMITRWFLLTKVILDHGWKKNYRSSLKKLQNLLEAPINRDEHHHLFEYWTNKLIIGSAKSNRKLPDEMDKVNQALNSFYIENKLMVMTEMANRKQIIQSKSSLPIWDNIIDSLESKQFYNSIGIEIYFHLYKMMTEESENHYNNVKEALAENGKTFSIEYKKPIYHYLMNRCMAFINQGKIEYAHDYLGFIDQMVREKIILEGGEMPPPRLKNMVSASLLVNKDNWAENYVNSFSQFLPKSDRRSITLFGQAQINFYRAEYRMALKKLNGFTFKDMYYRIAYEILLLKIYYELKDFDALFKRAATFRKYLSREVKLSDRKKTAVRNFIKGLTDIVKYKGYDKQKTEELTAYFEKEKIITDREWLLSKVKKKGQR